MTMVHKSIFAKVKEYKGNPIDEYNKIKSFLKNKCCYSNESIYSLLSNNFKKCELLRGNYTDLYSCLSDVNKTLELYKTSVFSYLDEKIQDELMDSFLIYCEVVTYVYLITWEYYVKANDLYNSSYFDRSIYKQLLEIIKSSLKSMNHDIRVIDENTFETLAFKCNPDAECVAEKSPSNLKEAIYYYLGTKDSNIEEKQNKLHIIIDLIEPLLKKYKKECNVISRVEEYVQLIRHPELKKEETQYGWFFKDKNSYLDDMFMLCVFVKEYDISKSTIREFEELKKNS